MTFDCKVWLVALVAAGVLTACASGTPDYKGVYEVDAVTQQPLEVPPDLDNPQQGRQMELPPELATTYSSYRQTQKDGPLVKVAPEFKSMRFVREGGLYWVEIQDTPENIWSDLREFFVRVGFEIKAEYPQVGLMETNWVENRIGIPTNWFAKLIRKLYSTGLLDKYRIRVERVSDTNVTRVFISHQGLKEVAAGEGQVTPDSSVETYWASRSSESELEVEMLMRFMAYRGIGEEAARTAVAAAPAVERSKLEVQQNQDVLVVNDNFARTWRYLEIAMDRLGYVIEDRNRSAGIYYIRLPENFRVQADKGFLGIFSSNEVKPKTDAYMLLVESRAEKTVVSVRERNARADDHIRVVKQILVQLQQSIL